MEKPRVYTKNNQIEVVQKDSESGMWACFVELGGELKLVELEHEGYDVFEEHASYALWIESALENIHNYVFNYHFTHAA